MDNGLEKRLKEIKIENVVFLIFIILILLAYYANEREVDYFLNRDQKAKNDYYYLMIIIFLVVVIVSGYYFYDCYKEVLSNNDKCFSKESKYAYLELMANGATFVAGLIYLYIAVTDKNIDAEISL